MAVTEPKYNERGEPRYCRDSKVEHDPRTRTQEPYPSRVR